MKPVVKSAHALKLPAPRLAVWAFMFLSLIFYGVFYKYNLYFQEQLQLFLLTGDYFLESIQTPGGFSGYLGEFFTQFYHLPFAGAVIITLLLVVLQQFVGRLMNVIRPKRQNYLWAFVPSVWYAMVLSNELYLLSGLVGLVISTGLASFTISVQNNFLRRLLGFAGILVVYFLTGGSYFLFALSVLVYELWTASRQTDFSKKRTTFFLVSVVFAGAVLLLPFLVKRILWMVPHQQAYFSEHYYKISTAIPLGALVVWLGVPALMVLLKFSKERSVEKKSWLSVVLPVAFLSVVALGGFKLFASMSSERTKAFDYFVRQKKWDQVIRLAEKDYPRNPFTVSYINLALAKTGQLPDKMFHYRQVGIEGLFYPYNREHLTSMLGNEIFYELGLVNVSQQYAFESTEATPDLRKTVRALKRLAEVNLINGQYDVAQKYIQKLRKTLFYRGWAQNLESYLFNREKIDADPEYGEKRKMRPRQDYFFDIKNIEAVLLVSMQDNPQNKMAYEYLMAFYLLKKDLKSFMKFISHAKTMGYRNFPVSYQEAVMYVLGLYSKNPELDTTFPISENTKVRLRRYADIYTSEVNAEQVLEKDFEDTYWYYFHYR